MASSARRSGALAPTELPPGLPDDWPVPWEAVWGTADGIGARISAALAEVVFELGARLPERVLALVIGGLARIGRRVDRRHAAAGRRFLRQALGELPPAEMEARLLQSYRHFFRVLVSSRRFLRRVRPERTLERYDVRWSADARRIAESDQGCIIVTCHVGDWEAGLAAAPWLGFGPVYGVAKPLKNRPLSISAQRERELRGIRLLPRRGAMRAATKILRASGTITMVLDQRARKRPVLAPFFGRPARCDRSAGVLMKRLGAPVLIASCTLTDEPLRYRFEFVDCLWPADVAGMDPAGIATTINRTFERMIREHPEQYFWLHDRYKDTPETFPVDIPRPEALDPSGGPVSSERGPGSDRREVPKA